MAATDHYLRFRMMSDEELRAEKARLNAMNSGFASQGMGTKQWTIATNQILEQLNAIAFVMKERGLADIPTPARVNNNIGVIDFSGMS